MILRLAELEMMTFRISLAGLLSTLVIIISYPPPQPSQPAIHHLHPPFLHFSHLPRPLLYLSIYLLRLSSYMTFFQARSTLSDEYGVEGG